MTRIWSLIFFLLIVSCAQQVAPNGGPKDEKPPKVVGTKPENKSVHFNSDKIIIKFDEYIQIKDPSQIVISPYLKDKPSIEAVGKTIEVTFLKSKPEANTTYTINFGNSVADMNEGNIYNNLTYVFATGAILDSNVVAGNVWSAFKLEPQKDIVVGLYKKQNFTDTTLYKFYPNYFAKSKDSGDFVIENLPNDTFYLYAFKDASADNKYQKNELVAFDKTPVIAREETSNLKLKLFEPYTHPANYLLDTISKQKGKFQLVFYKPEILKVKPLNYKKYYTQISKGKANVDSFNIYIPQALDSGIVSFEVSTKDSSYTLSFRTKNKSRIPEFIMYATPAEKPGDSIHIFSTTPIDTFGIQHLQFKEDTLEIKPTYLKTISPFEWVLYYPFKEQIAYTLTIIDSAITNVYGKYNKKLHLSFSGPNSKDFGSLQAHFTYSGKEPLILQLVQDNAEEQIIHELFYTIPNDYTFNNIKPGVYRVKLILDKNRNGVWDNGDVKKLIEPEEVFYLDTPITIKAYWDIEQSINLDNIISN